MDKFNLGLIEMSQHNITNNFMLKQRVLSEFAKGNKIRIMDLTGEFTALVKQLDGKTIPLDKVVSASNLDDESIVSFSCGNFKILDSENSKPQVFISNCSK